MSMRRGCRLRYGGSWWGSDLPQVLRLRVTQEHVTLAQDDTSFYLGDMNHFFHWVNSVSLALSAALPRVSVERDVIAPWAGGCGVGGGAEAGEGAEVVVEVRLIVVTAGESKLRPGDVCAGVELVDGLLEALNTAVELRRYADVLAEELRETSRAETRSAR